MSALIVRTIVGGLVAAGALVALGVITIALTLDPILNLLCR